jgi:hypothetical protein
VLPLVKLLPARLLWSLLFPLALLAGCSSRPVSTRKVMPLDRFQRIFVEHRLNENNHLDDIFVAELRQLGREVSSGPMTMMPENTDAILTYDARWERDFKAYLVELTLELHSVHPHKKLADASYHQPTSEANAPEIIRKMLGELFAKPALATSSR